MKTRFIGLMVMLSACVITGCASPQTEITRQDIADARGTIVSAKLLGAQAVAPDEIARAEHYYKLAQDDFNRAADQGLRAGRRARRTLEESASANAQRAKSQAERALFIINAQKSASADIDALQSEADELKMQVARLERERDMYHQQQTAAAMALEKERASSPSATGAKGCTTDAEALYNKAFYLFQTRRYDQARALFERHRQLYQDQLSDNAQFWIGECYFMQQQYAQALSAFQAVLKEFPDSNKRSDTYLSIGLCQHRLNHREAAIQNWMTVTQKYPASAAAGYARKFLNLK